MGGNVWVKSGKVIPLIGKEVRAVSGTFSTYTNGATTTVTGNYTFKDSPYTTFQATVTGTGAVAATVVIDCSNDGTNWCTTSLGTITLTGTTTASDGFTTTAPWKFVRARVTAISGTGASVIVLMGV